MSVEIIFKIAGVGLITSIVNQILKITIIYIYSI